jgi:ribosomal protein L29
MKELKDLKLMDNSKLDSLDESKLTAELRDSEKKLFTFRMKLNV